MTGMRTVSLEVFMSQFADEMARDDVQHCVLRNYEGLPRRNVGGDIDLLVSAVPEPALARTVGRLGLVVTSLIRRSYVTHAFVAGVQWDRGQAIQLDFITSLNWKGIAYIDTDGLLSRSTPLEAASYLRRPDPRDEAIAKVMPNVLVAGFMKERYADEVREVLSRTEGAADLMLPCVPGRLAHAIIDRAAAGEWEVLCQGVPQLRKQFLWHAIKGNPWSVLKSVATYYLAELTVRFSPQRETTLHVLVDSGTQFDAAELNFRLRGFAKEVIVQRGCVGRTRLVVQRRLPSRFSRLRVVLCESPPRGTVGAITAELTWSTSQLAAVLAAAIGSRLCVR